MGQVFSSIFRYFCFKKTVEVPIEVEAVVPTQPVEESVDAEQVVQEQEAPIKEKPRKRDSRVKKMKVQSENVEDPSKKLEFDGFSADYLLRIEKRKKHVKRY
uniref:Uncharacterized protein n=1 Tax=Panagrolaimus sp. JU765 TaxID=591449 RepID=A0AC34QR07_9BILA